MCTWLNDTYEVPWIEYNITASTGNYQFSHSQEYLLRDLTPGSEYVVKMRARNVFGASEITEEFLFRTAAGFLILPPFMCDICCSCSSLEN